MRTRFVECDDFELALHIEPETADERLLMREFIEQIGGHSDGRGLGDALLRFADYRSAGDRSVTLRAAASPEAAIASATVATASAAAEAHRRECAQLAGKLYTRARELDRIAGDERARELEFAGALASASEVGPWDTVCELAEHNRSYAGLRDAWLALAVVALDVVAPPAPEVDS